MDSILLHNPGCNNPDKICSPHPTGISDIIYAINNPVEFGVPLLIIATVVISIGLYRRWQNENGESEA